ncbi:MAG: GWxTD domain-containing protein [Saprospiraceae bacterium]|nr:GWxTD domain-containing protein [Saprospiraceae bacterium]
MLRASFIICFVLLSHLGFSINIDVNVYTFYGAKSYVEVYTRVDCQSITWNPNGNKQIAGVNFILIISNNIGEIVAYDKFDLKSESKDTIRDFLTVKRFHLLAGNYTVKVEAADINKVDNKVQLEKKVDVDAVFSSVGLSDIQLLGTCYPDSSDNALAKNGVYTEPLAYQYLSPKNEFLRFYIEVYRADSSMLKDYFLQYAILEGFKDNMNATSILSKYKKLNFSLVEPLMLTLPAKEIKSGDYHLVINIQDKLKNIIATRKVNFTKSNPVADIAFLENYNDKLGNSFAQKIAAEDMDYILKALLPITDQNQVSTLGELLKSNKLKSQQSFIFQMWKVRSPANPEESYKAYMDVARAVDKKFYSNVGYGFQSDRGHIFLKYGKPSNVLAVDTEVDAPPYEIWYYTYLPTTRQTNVRFLFYNPSLSHNDYKLLHSTCLGERTNPAWETVLYGSVPQDRQGTATDATTVKENFNRNARRYFNEY